MAGRVFAGSCVNVARCFVTAQLAFVLVANAVAVGGAERALDPLAFDFCWELRNAAVKGFFVFGSDSIVGGTGAAATVVLSSNGGKGVFNIRKEFLEFAVLASGTPIKMAERPLDDLVTVCLCSCQVFEIGVEIVGQVCTLGETRVSPWNGVWLVSGGDVVDKLDSGRRSELILSPC